MKPKLLLELAVDVLLISLLVCSIDSWIINPAHQISQELKENVAVVMLGWIFYRIFTGENRDDDWARQFYVVKVTFQLR